MQEKLKMFEDENRKRKDEITKKSEEKKIQIEKVMESNTKQEELKKQEFFKKQKEVEKLKEEKDRRLQEEMGQKKREALIQNEKRLQVSYMHYYFYLSISIKMLNKF